MSDSVAYINNRFLAHLDRIIIERGEYVPDLLNEAGLPYSMVVHADTMVPFANHMRMLELTEQRLAIGPLGLVLAARQFIANLSPLFALLTRQPSVGAALTEFNNNMEVVVQGLDGVIKADGRIARYEMSTELPFLRGNAVFQDHALGLMAQLIRWLVGPECELESVLVVHDEPDNLICYRSFFGCPVGFSNTTMAVCFKREYLDLPVSSVAKSLKKQHNKVLELGRNASLLVKVRSAIRENIEQGHFLIDDIAALLGMSTRTLQRRLKERGTCFNYLLDSVRVGLIRRLLASPEYSMADIAAMTGYADQACFTKGFKRLYGESPSTWRKMAQQLQSS